MKFIVDIPASKLEKKIERTCNEYQKIIDEQNRILIKQEILINDLLKIINNTSK